MNIYTKCFITAVDRYSSGYRHDTAPKITQPPHSLRGRSPGLCPCSVWAKLTHSCVGLC